MRGNLVVNAFSLTGIFIIDMQFASDIALTKAPAGRKSACEKRSDELSAPGILPQHNTDSL